MSSHGVICKRRKERKTMRYLLALHIRDSFTCSGRELTLHNNDGNDPNQEHAPIVCAFHYLRSDANSVRVRWIQISAKNNKRAPSTHCPNGHAYKEAHTHTHRRGSAVHCCRIFQCLFLSKTSAAVDRRLQQKAALAPASKTHTAARPIS